MKRFIYTALALLLLISVFLPYTSVQAANVNLIANPSAETTVNNLPQGWTKDNWGTNTPTFTYATTGHIGSRSLYVSVANYASGDAKWVADQVAVTAGQTYQYSDYSESNVATELDAAYSDASGNMTYVYLQSIAASSS